MAQHALQPVFAPTSVAVLTGEDATHPIMLALLRAMRSAPNCCPVTLIGVKPEIDIDISTFTHYESLAQLKTHVDLVILAGKSNESLEKTIADCSRAHLKSLLMLTWTDAEPETIRNALRENGVRLLGPSSFGICRPKRGVFAWLGSVNPLPGRLAFMSQSGTIASALVDWATWQGIGFSQVIALGAPVDIMPWQALDCLSMDFESRAILMYLQKIGQTTHFLSSLRSASRTKPVAVVAEHAIGADERVLDAALSRTGAVRGRRLNDLVAAASVMSNARRIKEGSLLIIGNGAGPGALAAQRAEELNVALLDPEDELRNKLSAIVADMGSIGPVTTVWGSCASAMFVELADAALADRSCGAILLMLSPTALIDIASLHEQVLALHNKQNKPVMVCLLGGGNMVRARTRLTEAGIPTFRTPETAIEGYQFLVQFQRNQRLAKQSPESHALSLNIDVEQARKYLKQILYDNIDKVGFKELKPVFNQFNLPVTSQHDPSTDFETPLNVRVFRDPVFGPTIGLALGSKGQWQKHLEVVALPPLNIVLVRDLINQLLPGWKSFGLENFILNLSTLVCELPEIVGLEFSDVHLLPDARVYAGVKADLGLSVEKRRYDHLAIQPYPRQWVSEYKFHDGRCATIRPVRPEDATIMADFVRNLSHESRYFRFIANFSELTPRMLTRFCHIDYDREMELLAVMEEDDKIVELGAARYSDNFDGHSCEFAVVVGDKYQGFGLAAYLMRKLFLVAADNGLSLMEGTVLAENKHMINFCRKLGFRIRMNPDDMTLVIAEITLTPKLIAEAKQKLSH